MGKKPVHFGESLSRVSKTGAIGDPTVTTAEKGEKLLDEAANNLVRFVREFKKRKINPAEQFENENEEGKGEDVN